MKRATAAKAPKPTRQLPLLDAPELRESELLSNADVQERHRIRDIQQRADEQRHERWALHNAGKEVGQGNYRPCPCTKCCKRRRAELRASR